MRQRKLAVVAAVAALVVGVSVAGGGAHAARDPENPGVARLEADASAGLRLERDSSGVVDFVGTSVGNEIVNDSVSAGTRVRDAARAHLTRYGAALGLTRASELRLTREASSTSGHDVVRFQQEIDSAPVIGGQVVVTLHPDRQLGSMLSTLSSARSLPGATVDEASAEATALGVATRAAGVDGLAVTRQGRAVWDPAVFGAPGDARGVWGFEVGDGAAVRRLVLVDDTSGRVVLDLDQIQHIDRVVCDAANVAASPKPCTSGFARIEGESATGVTDVDRAYVNAGRVSTTYQQIAGLDLTQSIGISVGGVKKLASTVRYCAPGYDCPVNDPYENAFWNGKQMYYGDGYANADDVVGHEMTHGVIDQYSELFYWGQSGAINESLADILGEVVDHRFGTDDDSPWEVGEGLPGGAIRSLKDPTAKGAPDRMTSSLWDADLSYWGFYGEYPDSGGVHTNSGVGNKTAYLISQGGTFNGQTITGIDASDTSLTKTGTLYVDAITRLTSGSDYADLAAVLEQSCADLATSGTAGFTSVDCANVAKAVAATELRTTATNAPQPPDAVQSCPAGSTLRELFNSETDPETKLTPSDRDVWSYGVDSYWGSNATSGRDSWFSDNVSPALGDPSSASLVAATGIPLPAGQQSFLSFQQWRVFEWYPRTSEPSWFIDGGTVEVDAGSGPVDTSGLPWTNGPQQVLQSYPDETNEWAGRRAFGGDSFGWTTSQLDLSSFAGQTVRPSFTTRGDGTVGFVGWWLDDISVYTCDVAPAPAPAPAPTTAPAPTPATTTYDSRTTLRVRKGTPVRVIAKVTLGRSTRGTGKVTITIDRKRVKKTIRLRKGKAVLRLTSKHLRRLGPGKHKVKAVYRGLDDVRPSKARATFRLR